MPAKARPLALAAIAALIVTVVCLGAVILAIALPWIPTAAILAALLLVVAWPALDSAGRWALGPRGRAVSALTLASASVPLLLGALYTLGQPVVDADRWRCGTGDVALLLMAPPVILVLVALASLVSTVVAGGAPAALARRTRWLAVAAVAVSAGLVAASSVRAGRFPESDGYVASLPVVARVTAASGYPVAVQRAAESPLSGPGAQSETVRVYDDRLGPVVLRRRCIANECDATLLRASQPDAASAKRVSHERVPSDRAIEVHRDAAHDIWVVDSGWARPYRGPDLDSRDVHVADIADHLSPPHGWLVCAALGLALAGALLLVRRRAARDLRAIEAGRQGVLEASGLVRFGDGEPPVRVAPGQALAEGPVVVFPGALVSGGAYRADAPGGARVACGDREAILARVRERLALLDALAFAACALTGAPLLACAIVGLV